MAGDGSVWVSERRSITGSEATLDSVSKTLAAAVFVLALAVSAQALSAAVPGQAQAQMKTILGSLGAGDFAYVPTYLPKGYRYDAFSASTEGNDITVSSKRFGPNSLLFHVARSGRKASSCGKGSVGAARFHGVTVFLAGKGAWRCLRAPSGRVVVVTVVGSGLTTRELGAVAASASRAR